MDTRLSRRRFAVMGAAAAAGALWFDMPQVLQAANIDLADDAFGGFPVGAQSYSLREFNTLDAVRHLHGMGLHYVEMFDKHLATTASDEQIKETLKLLGENEIKLVGHGVHAFTKDHEANRKYFEFAKKAGFKVITANPEYDSFDSLDKLVAEYDVRIAIHNHGPGALYDKISSVTKVLEGRHPHVGACVDCGHFIRTGEDPVEAVMKLGPRVFAAHIKDDVEKGAGSKNVVIGKGHLDVVGLFKALRKIKFPAYGSLALEYEANPDNPIADMKECIEVAKDAIKKSA